MTKDIVNRFYNASPKVQERYVRSVKNHIQSRMLSKTTIVKMEKKVQEVVQENHADFYLHDFKYLVNNTVEDFAFIWIVHKHGTDLIDLRTPLFTKQDVWTARKHIDSIVATYKRSYNVTYYKVCQKPNKTVSMCELVEEEDIYEYLTEQENVVRKERHEYMTEVMLNGATLTSDKHFVEWANEIKKHQLRSMPVIKPLCGLSKRAKKNSAKTNAAEQKLTLSVDDDGQISLAL